MNDWAKNAVERLKHTEEATRGGREPLNREYRTKQGQGRILFSEIGDLVREGIKAININYGSDAIKSPMTPAAEIKVIAQFKSEKLAPTVERRLPLPSCRVEFQVVF